MDGRKGLVVLQMTHRIFDGCKAPARSSWDFCCEGADARRSKHGASPTQPKLGGQEGKILHASRVALFIPLLPDEKPHRSDSSPARPTAATHLPGGQSTLDAWQTPSFSPSPQPAPPSTACLRLAPLLTALLPPPPCDQEPSIPPARPSTPNHPAPQSPRNVDGAYFVHGTRSSACTNSETVEPSHAAPHQFLLPPLPQQKPDRNFKGPSGTAAAAIKRFQPRIGHVMPRTANRSSEESNTIWHGLSCRRNSSHSPARRDMVVRVRGPQCSSSRYRRAMREIGLHHL